MEVIEKPICRLCLGNEPNIQIFQHESKLCDKIVLCCNIQMDENDRFPKQICSNCMESVTKAVDFRLMCESNDKILRQKYYFQKHEAYFDNNMYDNYYEEPEMPSESIDIKDIEKINQADLKTEKVAEVTNEITIPKMKKVKKKDLRKEKKAKKFKDKIRIKLDKNNETGNNTPQTDNSKLTIEAHEQTKEIKPKQKRKKMTLEEKKGRISLCPICGKYIRRINLANHIRNHNAERKFKCDQCQWAFKNEARLKIHMAVHSEERSISCSLCDQKFKFECSLSYHMKSAHTNTRNAECKVCGMKFVANFILNKHMRTHTQEYTHECEICHKKLKSKYSYDSHKMIHTGEKPWPCHYCESKFANRKNLMRHERLHTGEKPYACPCCDKAFSQLGNMKSHFRNNHKDVNFDDVYQGKKVAKYVQ